MQCGERVDLCLIDRAALRRRRVRQAAVPQDSALDHRHDVKGRPDDAFVVAICKGVRPRTDGFSQRVPHAIFAINSLRRVDPATVRAGTTKLIARLPPPPLPSVVYGQWWPV